MIRIVIVVIWHTKYYFFLVVTLPPVTIKVVRFRIRKKPIIIILYCRFACLVDDSVDGEMGESKILYLERAMDIVQQLFAKSTISIAVCYIFSTYLLQYFYV